jgi:DNA-binding winged helix-turn-helix (wHTH) protein/predicted negative regulator of RcsB-dependent stress response
VDLTRVTIQFGQFVLDETARFLRLGDRELHVQPLVFDLLVYLVRSRPRAVSKDELLEALWPGVIVTENSLQRAVSSLRTVLREGQMEDAVRNIPRAGYRFCADAAEQAAIDGESSLNAARVAAAHARWEDVIALYSKLCADDLKGEDFDHWGMALQCVGTPFEAIRFLTTAVDAHIKSEDCAAAAMSAIALSAIHLERGELAIAKGWLARAEELAPADSVGVGRVAWMQARISASEGDPQGALEWADAAYNIGRVTGDAGSEALGLIYRGFFRLSLGDTLAGLTDQDHAAALALSNRIDPVTGGTIYCNILWACRTFGDWSRASQWTLGYRQFCTSSNMKFSGSCQLHRAEVLGVQGSLQDALVHIDDALMRLGHDAPWARGDGYRVLGDIHSAIGNDDAARAAYEASYAFGWDPEPGRALMLLDAGDTEAAYNSLERSLIGQSWWTLQRHGMLLAHLARVAAHAGKYERAQALIDDLSGQDKRWPMASIRALTNEASAVLAAKHGRLEEGLRFFHLARQLWTSVESRFNATRVRLEIAAAQLELKDEAGAAAELRAALADAKELGSLKLQRKCAALQALV